MTKNKTKTTKTINNIKDSIEIGLFQPNVICCSVLFAIAALAFYTSKDSSIVPVMYVLGVLIAAMFIGNAIREENRIQRIGNIKLNDKWDELNKIIEQNKSLLTLEGMYKEMNIRSEISNFKYR